MSAHCDMGDCGHTARFTVLGWQVCTHCLPSVIRMAFNIENPRRWS